MRDKLTNERVYDYVLGKDLSGLMALIEADREAVRAETREVLLKDHFKAEEEVQFQVPQTGEWIDANMVPVAKSEMMASVGWPVRRRPKKRAMTHSELASRVSEVYGIGMEETKSLNGDTLADLLRNRGFPVQVEE